MRRPNNGDAVLAASEYCDRHRGYVDEGRTKPDGYGSRRRICDACREEMIDAWRAGFEPKIRRAAD